MRALTATEILSAQDTAAPVAVPVPEWGEDACVYLRIMSGAERNAFEASNMRVVGNKVYPHFDNVAARLVAICACDAQGNRLFTDKQAADLGRKNGIVLNRLHEKAQEINGMTVGAVDDFLSGSGANQNDGSGSGSPSPTERQ